MKYNTNKSIALLLITFSLLPILAFGESSATNDLKTENKNDKNVNNFCLKLSNLNEKLANQVKKTEDRQSLTQINHAVDLNKKESNGDSKKAISRLNTDTKRIKNWNKITNKAKTPEQLAAVESYKKSVQNAIDSRKIAVDAAVKTFKEGLALVNTTYTNSLSLAMTAFKTSVDNALIKAKTDCANNVTSKTVNSTFTKTVNDARSLLKTARKDALTNSGIANLKKTRDDAIKSAEDTFKTANDKAYADLLIILK